MNEKQIRYEKKKKIIDEILEIDLKIETYSKFGQMGAAKQLKAKKNELEMKLDRLSKGGESIED